MKSCSSLLVVEHDRSTDQLVHAADHAHLEAVVGQHLGELGLADGADGGHEIDAVVLHDAVQRFHARQGALDPQVEQFVGQQAAAAVTGMIRTESLRARPLQDSARSDRAVSSSAYRELIVTDLRPELPRITAPTTVLYVAFDFPGMTPAMCAVAMSTLSSSASDNGRRLRRIADHVRACTFAIHENVLPGPNREKYVIRRLLRRAVLDGYQLGLRDPFLFQLVPKVAELMGEKK